MLWTFTLLASPSVCFYASLPVLTSFLLSKKELPTVACFGAVIFPHSCLFHPWISVTACSRVGGLSGTCVGDIGWLAWVKELAFISDSR